LGQKLLKSKLKTNFLIDNWLFGDLWEIWKVNKRFISFLWG